MKRYHTMKIKTSDNRRGFLKNLGGSVAIVGLSGVNPASASTDLPLHLPTKSNASEYKPEPIPADATDWNELADPGWSS